MRVAMLAKGMVPPIESKGIRVCVEVKNPSHHRMTSGLDAFEVAQRRTLCTANVGGLRAAGYQSPDCNRRLMVKTPLAIV